MAVLDLKDTREQFKGLKTGDKIYSASVSKVKDDTFKAEVKTLSFIKLIEEPTAPKEPTEKSADSVERYARQLRAYEKYKKAYDESLFALVEYDTQDEDASYKNGDPKDSQGVINLAKGMFLDKKSSIESMKLEIQHMLDALNAWTDDSGDKESK